MRYETDRTLKSTSELQTKVSDNTSLSIACSRALCLVQEKHNKRVLRMQGAITRQLLFALPRNRLGMMQSPNRIGDADKLFCDFVSSLIYSVCHIVIVCQHSY